MGVLVVGAPRVSVFFLRATSVLRLACGAVVHGRGACVTVGVVAVAIAIAIVVVEVAVILEVAVHVVVGEDVGVCVGTTRFHRTGSREHSVLYLVGNHVLVHGLDFVFISERNVVAVMSVLVAYATRLAGIVAAGVVVVVVVVWRVRRMQKSLA